MSLSAVTLNSLGFFSRNSYIICAYRLFQAFNSLGQDPCKIATDLGSPCVANGVIIPPLMDPTKTYGGPSPDNQTQCSCSSVYYSALMVCAVCQGAGQVTCVCTPCTLSESLMEEFWQLD
jgi:hypothetical protein